MLIYGLVQTEESNVQTLSDLHWRIHRIGERIALQQFNGHDVTAHLRDFRQFVLHLELNW